MKNQNVAFPSVEELARIQEQTLERDKAEPRVLKVFYDTNALLLVMQMRGGAILQLPQNLLPGLAEASDAEIAGVRADEGGSSLHWDSLDVQVTVPSLIARTLGVVAVSENARKAGSTRSEAKSAAARANGAKSKGRPRVSAGV